MTGKEWDEIENLVEKFQAIEIYNTVLSVAEFVYTQQEKGRNLEYILEDLKKSFNPFAEERKTE